MKRVTQRSMGKKREEEEEEREGKTNNRKWKEVGNMIIESYKYN